MPDGLLLPGLPAVPAPLLRQRPSRRRPPAPQTGPWLLEAGINVVLFAGLGGACDGLERAGLPVHLAVNHDEVAIAVHAARHPHTVHLHSDVFEVDPRRAVAGRRVNVLWASPDCRHHSRAKGGALVSNRVRSLPWVVCRWLGQAQPLVCFTENVSELRGWCPLVAKRDKATGRVVKRHGTIAGPGERVPVHEQFLVPDRKRQGRTFRRWVRHIESLGYRYEDRDLVAADYGVPTTRRRFFAVMRRDGMPAAWPARTHAPRDMASGLGLLPWIPAATIIDWSLPLKSIFGRDRPLADATMRRIARGVVRYVIEARRPFIVPVTHGGDLRVHSVDDPLRTQTTAHRGEFAVVSPFIAGLAHGYSGGRREYGIDEPVTTVHAGGGNQAVVGAWLAKFRRDSAGADLNEPLPTYTASSFLKRPGGAAPIGVAGAFLTKFQQNSIGQPPTEPLDTVMAGAQRFGVVGAWLAQHNTGLVGHSPEAPLSTLVTKGCTQALAGTALVKLRGTSRDGQPVDLPAPTLSAQGNHVGLVAAFLEKYYGAGGQDQPVDQPLDTLTAKARFGVVGVEIDGAWYAIADIGMRMLEPEEGAAAHGFAAGVFPAPVTVGGKSRPLTKQERMALVGNSVPPRMAEVLARANPVQALAHAPIAGAAD